MAFPVRWQIALIFASVLLLPVTRSLGQTDVDLLVKPWQDGQSLDTSTNAVIESSAPTRENRQYDVGLSSYEAMGRWRLFPDIKASPRLGYDVSYFNIATNDPALPRHLWDGTIGFAQPVAAIDKWFVVFTGAAGYAGDSPFSDPHAAYFTGNLIIGKEFSKERALVFALNYDGDRDFLPDVPIPAIAYADRYNKVLTYVIGVPLNSIRYEPLTGLQLDLGWEFFQTFSGRLGWEFRKNFSVFSTYTDRLTGFHISDMPADRRLFLQEHRAEVGFRWNPTQLIKFSVGGGWAFGQEFFTGFDIRETNSLRHLRDGPFASALIEIGL